LDLSTPEGDKSKIIGLLRACGQRTTGVDASA